MEEFSVSLTEVLCFGASVAFTGMFYRLYKEKQSLVDKLDNAPHFNIDANLKNILKKAPGGSLEYAVIEGTVVPVGELLKSNFDEEVVGVMQKFTLKEHSMVWSATFRKWVDTEQILHQRVNVIPFLLAGLDDSTVRVLNPLQASGLYTEITNQKFHHASCTFGELVGQYVVGEMPKGYLEIEELLKVGRTLTGIGELILDKEGNVCLRPPPDNSQYFLSLADFETLRNECSSEAFSLKALAVVSALAGAAILMWIGLRYYKHRKRRQEREREIAEFKRLLAEGANQENGEETSSQASNRRRNECVICFSQPRDCILLDCRHVCCCYSCFLSLPQQKCPICRQDIVRVMPIFHV